MTNVINFYHLDDDHGCFSNFARYPITMDDKVWPTSEHWFQAQKFVGTEIEASVMEAIRGNPSPRQAFLMGRNTSKPRRSDWQDVRDNVMRQAVRAKFSQHVDLREILLATGDALIVEHTENDDYWGDGGDGHGMNMLGKILMEVRQDWQRESQTAV